MEIKNCNSLPKLTDDCGDNLMARSSSKSDIEKLETLAITADNATQEVELFNKINKEEGMKKNDSERMDKFPKQKLRKKLKITRIRYRKPNPEKEMGSNSEFKENLMDNVMKNNSECNGLTPKIEEKSEYNSSIDENDDLNEDYVSKQRSKNLKHSINTITEVEKKLRNYKPIKPEEEPTSSIIYFKQNDHFSSPFQSVTGKGDTIKVTDERLSTNNFILSTKNENFGTQQSQRYNELRNLIASRVNKSKCDPKQTPFKYTQEGIKSEDNLRPTSCATKEIVSPVNIKDQNPNRTEKNSQIVHEPLDSWILRNKYQQYESRHESDAKCLPFIINSDENSKPLPRIKTASFEDNWKNNSSKDTLRRFSLDGKLLKTRIPAYSEKFGGYLQRISNDVVNELKEKFEFDKKSSKSQITNPQKTLVDNKTCAVHHKKPVVPLHSFQFDEKKIIKSMTPNPGNSITHKSLKTYFENLSSFSIDEQKDDKKEIISGKLSDTEFKPSEKPNKNDCQLVKEKCKQIQGNDERNYHSELDRKVKKSLKSSEMMQKIVEKSPSNYLKNDFQLFKSPRDSSNNKLSNNDISLKTDSHSHKFHDHKIKSVFPINEKLILLSCDPRNDVTKSLCPIVSIKVTDLLLRKKTDPKDELPWALDTEEQDLVKRQPYLLKRLNRFNNCHVNNVRLIHSFL